MKRLLFAFGYIVLGLSSLYFSFTPDHHRLPGWIPTTLSILIVIFTGLLLYYTLQKRRHQG